MHVLRYVIVGLVFLFPAPRILAAPVHHDLEVVVQPDAAAIEVRDTISLPKGYPSSITFSLHPALQPRLPDKTAKLIELPLPAVTRLSPLNQSTGIVPRRYRVELAPGTASFTLHYSGSIAHSLQNKGEEYARSFQETQGIISPQGAFLSGASVWYPHIDDQLITFDLRIRLPETWKSMSQGEFLDTPTTGEHWHETHEQEEIYLVAGPFTAYTSTDSGVTAMVLLREADKALAQKYLDTTHEYIAFYSALVGPYPFTKFAMVENFWETGYGMPSFTLLGSRVIRFPFILHSSYPHEILHNWWGNSVYVDYANGNWAEGLTSYLADHLIKEQRGSGTEYRRNSLQKYTNYVSRQGDFPLTDFRSRHSARTEAVGYGKTLMLFHMLRRQLGDDAFKQGLKDFYQKNRFNIAGFSDVQDSFSAVAGKPLDVFFDQWVQRTGAPQIKISKAYADRDGHYYRLTAVIEQAQPGPAYTLRLPLAVHLEGVAKAYQTNMTLTNRKQTLALTLPARPVLLEVDPEFDIFRRLHRNEIPPAVSQAMGAERVLLVLPEQAPAALKKAYLELAKRWQREKPGQIDIASDTDIEALPGDRAVWLFGWHNRLRPLLNTALEAYDFLPSGEGVRIAGNTLAPKTHSLAVLGRQPQAPDQALGWIAADSAAAVPGLGRKLPHYGRYSYLGFTGTGPDNVLKGQWPAIDSPMSVQVAQPDGAPVSSIRATLAPRKALAPPTENFSSERTH